MDLEPKPFSEGCLRRAHRMWEYDTQGQQGGRTAFVAKFNKVRVQSFLTRDSVECLLVTG